MNYCVHLATLKKNFMRYQMSSEKQIKQLKEHIIFDIDVIMETLIHDYDLSKLSFRKTDIILSHKKLKRKIKREFKRLKYDK